MEVYRTKDGTVAKYIHDDGSETAIKTTPSEVFGGVYGKATNKFNVFVSSSVGCPVGCKFCYLTTKKCPYIKISAEDTTKNVIEALKAELKVRPELKNLYMKLSWMGMGDAFLDLEKCYKATLDTLEFATKANLIKGVDGVDISTTLPTLDTTHIVKKLNKDIIDYEFFNLNPKRNYSSSNSPVRLFYSLYSVYNKTRQDLIPVTVDINKAVRYLRELKAANINVILHHMFLEGINDGAGQLLRLLKIYDTELLHTELRVLRFNKCAGTTYEESKSFDNIIQFLHHNNVNLKIQSSPGSEVKAACGQFLLSKILD